jgi:hypothetical protein
VKPDCMSLLGWDGSSFLFPAPVQAHLPVTKWHPISYGAFLSSWIMACSLVLQAGTPSALHGTLGGVDVQTLSMWKRH